MNSDFSPIPTTNEVPGGEPYDDAELRGRIGDLEEGAGVLDGRVTALEEAPGGGDGYDDTELRDRIGAVELDLDGAETVPAVLEPAGGADLSGANPDFTDSEFFWLELWTIPAFPGDRANVFSFFAIADEEPDFLSVLAFEALAEGFVVEGTAQGLRITRPDGRNFSISSDPVPLAFFGYADNDTSAGGVVGRGMREIVVGKPAEIAVRRGLVPYQPPLRDLDVWFAAGDVSGTFTIPADTTAEDFIDLINTEGMEGLFAILDADEHVVLYSPYGDIAFSFTSWPLDFESVHRMGLTYSMAAWAVAQPATGVDAIAERVQIQAVRIDFQDQYIQSLLGSVASLGSQLNALGLPGEPAVAIMGEYEPLDFSNYGSLEFLIESDWYVVAVYINEDDLFLSGAVDTSAVTAQELANAINEQLDQVGAPVYAFVNGDDVLAFVTYEVGMNSYIEISNYYIEDVTGSSGIEDGSWSGITGVTPAQRIDQLEWQVSNQQSQIADLIARIEALENA